MGRFAGKNIGCNDDMAVRRGSTVYNHIHKRYLIFIK